MFAVIAIADVELVSLRHHRPLVHFFALGCGRVWLLVSPRLRSHSSQAMRIVMRAAVAWDVPVASGADRGVFDFIAGWVHGLGWVSWVMRVRITRHTPPHPRHRS